MRTELIAAQRLLLWHLIAGGGCGWQKNLRPEPRPALRKPLEDLGLIQVKKRGRQGHWISVTEQGWVWAEEHMGQDLETAGDPAAEVLQRVLEAFQRCLKRHDISFAEAFGPDRSVEGSIKRAYSGLANNRKNVRVRLADLRGRLTESRTIVDGALSRMMQAHELTLFRLDDPKQVNASDRSAAFTTPSGTEMHLVYLGGESS